jgi:hypothetical protein
MEATGLYPASPSTPATSPVSRRFDSGGGHQQARLTYSSFCGISAEDERTLSHEQADSEALPPNQAYRPTDRASSRRVPLHPGVGHEKVMDWLAIAVHEIHLQATVPDGFLYGDAAEVIDVEFLFGN